MEHLKFRRHKVNSRIYEVYKAIKNNTEDKTIKLPSDDPLESFCLYMNSGMFMCSVCVCVCVCAMFIFQVIKMFFSVFTSLDS